MLHALQIAHPHVSGCHGLMGTQTVVNVTFSARSLAEAIELIFREVVEVRNDFKIQFEKCR